LVEQADVWIHGHVHDSFDYRVGKCRVVANPGSYAGGLKRARDPSELVWENPLFDPQKLIEV
jgi:predicted phosphodiesterase